MATNFVTNTTSLKTTIADVRKLNAKKIFVEGENILDIINRGASTPTTTIKHANDTRTTVTENDLWGQYIETKADGTIVVHDDQVTNPNASNNVAWTKDITKVKDNKAYIGDLLYANVQTEKIKDGSLMFYYCDNLSEFSSDLSSLTDGAGMFDSCYNLTAFSTDLSSLRDGYAMFATCYNLTTFSSDLSSLTKCDSMFYLCQALESFTTNNLPNLTDGSNMFYVCDSLKNFYAKMANLSNGYAMFYGCSNLKSFSTDLSSLTDGQYMFSGCSNLESLNKIQSSSTDSKNLLSNLIDGSHMFSDCEKFESFDLDLSSLKNSSYMFKGCTNLKHFSSDMSSLKCGAYMFYYTTTIESFTSNLSSLTNGTGMLQTSKLSTFNIDLPSLTHSFYMFRHSENLKSFSSDLSSLTNGQSMFQYCYNLTAFASNLSSLTYGVNMFSGCSLDAKSVMYIADTIKDIPAEKQLYIDGTIPYVTEDRSVGWPYKYSATKGFMSDGGYVYTYDEGTQPTTRKIAFTDVGFLTLGINVTNNSSTIKQQLEDFAHEATFDSWSDLKKHFSNKGWTVTWQYGETNTSFTYGLRDGEQIIPCPIFAKLVQVEDKDSAEYCTEDASTFYNIEWGHDVPDTSSYTQFDSLEDAMASWNVFPKENIITTEE